MSLPTTQVHQWTRDGYLISTDSSLIPLDTLNVALDSDLLHWARALSPEELTVMVNSSACFGLYGTSASPAKPALIGFARLVTDRVTFAYLTDVYVLPEHGGLGLGSWLIDCVKEWVDLMPNLRQLTLITGKGKKEEYYARKLGTTSIENLKATVGVFVAKGPAGSFD